MNTMDLERIRAETPGCARVIHFNNAGSALMPDPVVDVIHEHLELERMIGGYEAMEQKWEQYEDYYKSFARLFNCDTIEIAYVENATRAWDMAFYSIPFRPGDRIVTSKAEYVSNYLAFLQVQRNKDVLIDVVPDDASGQISLPDLESVLRDDTRLIALTHVPTQSGLVNPAAEVGKIANKNNILYLLDACQSVGQLPVDVREIGCDMLSATGRKFLRGPRGTGVLYVKKSLIEYLKPPFIDLKSATWVGRDSYVWQPDARKFENWERYVAGQLGLARAVDYALELGLESIWPRVQLLAAYLRDCLSRLPGVTTHDPGGELCGIVTFTKSGEDAELTRKRLHHNGINTDVSRASSARLDFDERGLDSVVRASVHYYNTEEEVDRFCAVLNH